MKKIINILLATTLLGIYTTAGAVAIVYDNTSTVSIPGVANFQTFGDMMDGLSVTAVFDNGFTESLSWADTGAGAGGVTGTDWGLNVSGDTFGASWNFTNNSNLTLTSLVLDGAPGLTIFDTSNGGNTAGSESGWTFTDTNNVAITATYSNAIAIGAAAPELDTWQVLSIDFLNVTSGVGARGNFSFQQDTDNDIRAVSAPAPAVLALLGLGLVGMGAARRFRA